MTEYLEKLNPQQYEAATCINGPLLILAGAGSGKTGTMTHRIAYMIKDCGVSPYSILAVTFTNKAAGEMRERVENLVGPARGMWIATFHSACLRILRQDADKLGYGSNFIVYDPADQKALIKSIVKELSYDEKQFAPNYVLSIISQAKERETDAAAWAIRNASAPHSREIANLYSHYEKALKQNNAMDFDDLIWRTVQLFEGNPEVLAQYQQRFKYIMVDEYQDTNMLQYKLVHLLAMEHNNICVVGDDDQCIYEWRGADIRNILEFEKDFPGARIIKLEENYRSTGNIINAAHSVISRNKSRKQKKLWTNSEDGEKIEYYRANDDREEARYTGSKIKGLMRKDDNLRYSDFAVLYRTNVQSRRFEEGFAAMGIPYQVLSGLRYYDRKEIKDIISYMRLVSNPRDDVSLLRILNEPKRGIGPKSEEGIKAFAKMKGVSLLEALGTDEVMEGLSRKAAEAAGNLVSTLRSLNIEKDNMPVEELYDLLLVKSGYLPALEEQHNVEADGRIENLMEFKSVIQEKQKSSEENGEALSLESFMEGLALISDIDNRDSSEDAVVLMTLHSAKGLEFPVVFMPGMETGIFPSYRTIDQHADLEEERRLCYVGMTRAKKLLFMTSAEERMLYGKTDYTTESQFLKEIDRKYMSGNAIYEKKGTGMSFDRYRASATDTYSHGPYVSPLSTVAAVKKEAAKSTLSGCHIGPGDEVTHDKFGHGTIISVNGNVITIIFDEVGTKKMAKDLAPLKKVEK